MKKTTHRRNEFGWLASVLLLGGVAGCHIAPAYHPPVIQPPPAFKEAPPANPPAGTNQSQDNAIWRPAQPADAKIRGDWWNVFNDPELDDLEKQLVINNQNIKLYFENFMEARALVREARAQYFPTVSLGPSYSRSAVLFKPWRDHQRGQPGKGVADLLATFGCFLDAGLLWQNPQ